MSSPTLTGVHIFVRDMAASMAFYRLLGLEPTGSDDFARVTTVDGGTIEFGSYTLTRGYDSGFRAPAGAVPASCMQFRLESRAAVDATHARLVAAGYHSARPPFDAFWGSRYAEIDDPDGNIVGLQSPPDVQQQSAPPSS